MPVAVWIFLYRTKYGLEIRCVGENPKALDVKGLSVGWRQCLAIMFGSLMSALAVLMLAIPTASFPTSSPVAAGWSSSPSLPATGCRSAWSARSSSSPCSRRSPSMPRWSASRSRTTSS
ncbi:hypothetical protein SLT36_31675 (plasmid) [Aminobacter sp. BA135]